MLSGLQGDALLHHARQILFHALKGEALPAPARTSSEVETSLRQADRPWGGVFVTLTRGETLRGCVGRLQATTDLIQSVQDVARAALRDPRFLQDPITVEELKELNLEISVLSPPWLMTNPAELQPGVHGIYLRHRGASGCFLPKVAAQRGWDARTFLEQCCVIKAKLPARMWRQSDCRVWLFTAEVFSGSVQDRSAP